MGQRLIISEEERSRIAGMYGLVNEQMVPKNLRKIESLDIVGDTVNFYKDKENNILYSDISPSKIKAQGTLPGTNDFDIFIEKDGKPYRLTFYCQGQYFTPRDGFNVRGDAKYYTNEKLRDAISREYCSKNDAGKDVPKADWASNDDKGDDMSNMA